ncbi:MAG: hypothetical protein QG660_1028 [Pseudomonadota bacterium]|nr:hypothetical protein [Pseudomonadota bacterium]
MSWQERFIRPDSRFPLEIVEELLEALRDGRSMREICEDERMPSRETIRQWAEADDDLALAITRAREVGFFDRAERAVMDAKVATDPQKGRLAFDAERWFLGKVSKAFADKTVIAGDKEAPLTHEHRVSLADAPDEVLRYLAGQALPDEGR